MLPRSAQDTPTIDHWLGQDSATAHQTEDEWLWGWDPTPGIVSAWAESDGRAIMWRRITETGVLVREEAGFRPWIVLDRLDDLRHLGERLGREGMAGVLVSGERRSSGL
jgi:hypothetical protein